MPDVNFKRVLALLLFLSYALFAMGAQAQADAHDPNLFYKNDAGIYLDLGAAEAELSAQFARGPLASYYDVLGMRPVGTSTINGEQLVYGLHYQANSSHPEPRPSQIGVFSTVQRTAECGAGMGLVESGSASAKLVHCTRIPPCCTEYGNPISVSGVKRQEEIDYVGPGLLQFKRTFRSDRWGGWSHNYSFYGLDTGALTEENYRQRFNFGCVMAVGTITGTQKCYPRTTRPPLSVYETNEFVLHRPNGGLTVFKGPWYLPPASVNDRLKRIALNWEVQEWQVYNAQNDSNEIYSRDGKLSRITTRNGDALAFTYSDATTAPTIAPWPGLLIKVTDAAGRELNFIYSSRGLMTTLIDPSGGRIEYAYGEESSIAFEGHRWDGNLTSVTYQDGKRRVYWYSELDKTSGYMPYTLTGITDEEGNRYASFAYDEKGRGISTEHAGGVNKYTFNYANSAYTAVTDPLNVTKKNYFANTAGAYRSTSELMTFNGALVERTTAHDNNGNVIEAWDFAGILTKYTYDLARNLETKRTEGSNTRTVNTEWHPTERVVARVAEPKRITTFTHFPNGQVQTKSVQATADETGASGFSATKIGAARLWTYAYHGNGKIHTVTSPRTDVIDRITFNYDTQANLISVTNAAGHQTLLSNYDAHGKPGRITDPNGVITDITYSPRGWMTEQKVTAGNTVQITKYDRDGMGQLTKVTFPDTSYITYAYDAAHRLTDITDAFGNSVHYTLDNVGNRLEELTKDPGGSLTKKITRVYNTMNRLEQVTGGMQ